MAGDPRLVDYRLSPLVYVLAEGILPFRLHILRAGCEHALELGVHKRLIAIRRQSAKDVLEDIVQLVLREFCR